VLHGTPPFHVFHKTTHNGHETTNSTIINGSRGEITLQPERSGSYVYQFTALSDAHYKNVPLRSEPIKQTVHPLANALFAGKGTGGRETTVQSCSGNVVDVPVNLVGSAPWTLELQVVGPGGVAEKLSMKGIKKNQHTLQIKIPDDVDREGGTILVDLSA
jgi:nucleoporin POM152